MIGNIVAAQVNDYLDHNDFPETFQSVYNNHRTETSSVSAHSDILCALDKKEKGILLPLDLSAAIDTVDRLLHSSLAFEDWIWF